MKTTLSALMLTLIAGWGLAQEPQQEATDAVATPQANSMTTEELVELCVEQKTRLAEVVKQKKSWRTWCEKEVEKGWQPMSQEEFDRAKKRKYSWQ